MAGCTRGRRDPLAYATRRFAREFLCRSAAVAPAGNLLQNAGTPMLRARVDTLHDIARRAMIEHGLKPEFSAAVQRQADSLARKDVPAGAAIRDLRALLWSSIDNDDTRDLDQLVVAEPLADGVVKVLI